MDRKHRRKRTAKALFNEDAGDNMPPFLFGKGEVYLTHQDRKQIWKELIALEKKEGNFIS